MFIDIWKVRIESVLSAIGRDIGQMIRQGRQFLQGLEPTEQLVLLGLVMIGLFYLLIGHFNGGSDEEKAGGRFMGILFMTVAVAAGLGWMASGYTT